MKFKEFLKALLWISSFLAFIFGSFGAIIHLGAYNEFRLEGTFLGLLGILGAIILFVMIHRENSNVKDYRVVADFPDHGYEVRYDGAVIWHDVYDKELYIKMLKKKQSEILADLKAKKTRRPYMMYFKDLTEEEQQIAIKEIAQVMHTLNKHNNEPK